MYLKDQTYIIAEAGINHNGSFMIAKKLIHAAKNVEQTPLSFNHLTLIKL